MPLIALIIALVGGQSLGAILAGLSISEWIGLATTILPLGEDAIELLGEAHPALAALGHDLVNGMTPSTAAASANTYFANQPRTISGYGPDDGVVEIPNPDYRG